MNYNVSTDLPKSVPLKRTQVLKIRLTKVEESRIKSSSDRACVATWARKVLLAEQGTKPLSRGSVECEEVLPPFYRYSQEELKIIGQLTAAIACLNATIWEHECCDYDVSVHKLIKAIEIFMISRLYINDPAAI
ncbi:MAG: hypothetical protein U0998_11655 [Moraxellaceae bacterium]|nr:hypothetical protein [Moraxellaceae bacterium]MDZ4387826.1 hypothetical protein [Moraxellaceae bacterium]